MESESIGGFTLIILVCVLLGSNLASSSPTGCTYSSHISTCTFSSVTFPLTSSDFSSTPCAFVVQAISGTLPANALSGVATCPDTSVTDPILQLTCNAGNWMALASGAFSGGSLTWITRITIQDCVMDAGFPANIFAPLTGLTTLTVNGGSVGPLVDGSLAGLSSLTAFTFQSTFQSGTFSSGFFSQTTSLQNISITSSSMTSIPSGGFDGLTSLTLLDLSSNSFTTLPADLFKDMASSTSITLTGNAWACSCDLAWLVHWELYSGSAVTVTKDACNTPASLNGKHVVTALYSLGCFSSAWTETTTDPPISESTVDQLLNNEYAKAAATGVAFIISFASLGAACFVSTKTKTLMDNRTKPKITPIKMRNFDHK